MRKGDMHEILAEEPVYIVATWSLSCPHACIMSLKLDRVLTTLHVLVIFACFVVLTLYPAQLLVSARRNPGWRTHGRG